MSRKKIKHSNEFKKEATKLVHERGYSQVGTARRLGVNAKNLRRRVKKAEITNSTMPGYDKGILAEMTRNFREMRIYHANT